MSGQAAPQPRISRASASERITRSARSPVRPNLERRNAMSLAKFHPKMSAAVLAGFVTTVLIAEANRRGYPIDGTEGAGITGILMFAAGYLLPSDDAGPPAPPA